MTVDDQTPDADSVPESPSESAPTEPAPEAGTSFSEIDAGTVLDAGGASAADDGAASTNTAPDIAPGTTLGKYEVRKKLGAGGMGAVYLAFDPMIEREVAIKVLPAEIAARPQALDRFLTEAKATGKLNHPHVVSIFDIGAQDELNYIVMEVLRGGSVLEALDTGEPPAWEDACRLVADTADGLAAAHGAGLVHRDIKPENLMLTEDRIVKIVDFGLAKLLDATDDGKSAVTKVGQVMGTPQFMSPEQFGGSQIDHRSDIYSLGGTLYQLLTGRFPFTNCKTIVQMMYAHLEKPVPDPRELRAELPEGCHEIITRAMAKSPDARYQDAAEMANDLRSLVYGQPAAKSSEPAPAATATWRDLHRVYICEPSRMQAMMLRDTLTRSGIPDVQIQDSVADILDEETAAADMVVTAMHLPESTGTELINGLRTQTRYDQSLLVLNSSDSQLDEIVSTTGTRPLALVSKKTKPDELLRAVHACTFFNVAHSPFDTPIDPLAMRVLIITDTDSISADLSDLIRGVGLLDIQIASASALTSKADLSGTYDLTLHVRTAGTSEGDTRLYCSMMAQLRDLPTADSTAVAAVQIDGARAILRGVVRGGFQSVCHCPLDERRLTRLLQVVH